MVVETKYVTVEREELRELREESAELARLRSTNSEDGREVNPEYTLFNEIRISEPVSEEGEPCRYIITEQQLQRIRALEAELADLRAQPARQVGGDEQSARALFEEMALIADDEKCIQLLAAALAPAAVVMPELIYLRQPYEDRPWFWIRPADETERAFCTAFVRADEVARLNRRAIPLELIRRLLDEGKRSDTWLAQDELRALLGKEEK